MEMTQTASQASMAGFEAHILLVDDDPRLASLIKEYLESQGFAVCIEAHGDRATKRIIEEKPHLVILDIMLPKKDGFTICREIRNHFQGWILMLTAREDDMDQIVGLELGADDYLVKPVLPRLLLARIRNLLRRGDRQDPSSTIPSDPDLSFGQLTISPQTRKATLAGHAITLSTQEFDLLLLLANNAGQILSRESILRKLRGIDYDGLDRSVDVGISRLRRKLGDEGPEPQFLKTVRGQGYLFVPIPW